MINLIEAEFWNFSCDGSGSLSPTQNKNMVFWVPIVRTLGLLAAAQGTRFGAIWIIQGLSRIEWCLCVMSFFCGVVLLVLTDLLIESLLNSQLWYAINDVRCTLFNSVFQVAAYDIWPTVAVVFGLPLQFLVLG